MAVDFWFGRGAKRKHIRGDLRPRSNATKVKKRRHPNDKSTLQRLAALLAPYRPMRVCASLAPLPATTNCSCAVSSYL